MIVTTLTLRHKITIRDPLRPLESIKFQLIPGTIDCAPRNVSCFKDNYSSSVKKTLCTKEYIEQIKGLVQAGTSLIIVSETNKCDCMEMSCIYMVWEWHQFSVLNLGLLGPPLGFKCKKK